MNYVILEAAAGVLLLTVYAAIFVAFGVAIVTGVAELFGRRADREEPDYDHFEIASFPEGNVSLGYVDGEWQVTETDRFAIVRRVERFTTFGAAADCYESICDMLREDSEVRA